MLLCVDWDVDQRTLRSLMLNGLDVNLNPEQGNKANLFIHGEVCISEKNISAPHGAVLRSETSLCLQK